MENKRAVSRSVASTEAVIGRCPTACFAASIRIRARATLEVMVKFGVNLVAGGVMRQIHGNGSCR